MDKSIPISTLLDQVKSILSQQTRLAASYSDGTKDQAAQQDHNDSISILPESIPPLPSIAATLPQSDTTLVDASATASTKPVSSPISAKSDPTLENLVTILSTHILPYMNLSSLSPRYYGFVTGGATPAALIADIITSIYDQNASVHLPAETISTNLEVTALNMLVDLFRLPAKEWTVGSPATNGGGTITTGATASNILGLALGREYVLATAAARHRRQHRQDNATSGEQGENQETEEEEVSVGSMGLLKATRLAQIDDIYVVSTLPHSSIVKAAGVLGIGRENMISITKTNGNNDHHDMLGIDTEKFENLARSARSEKKAYILSVSTGEVNTGRFATGGSAELQKLREICDEHGIWMHVDGAFGLFGRVLMGGGEEEEEEGQGQEKDKDQDETYDEIIKGVQGLHLADSITGDCHKLLNVPYDCGIFFTRHKSLSERVFSNGNAAYLKSSNTDAIQSPLNIGIENSRRLRALPVYSTLLAYGRQGYVDMLQRQIRLTRRITRWMLTEGKEWFVVLPSFPSSSSSSSSSTTNEKEKEEEKEKKERIAKTFMVLLFTTRFPELNRNLVGEINRNRGSKIYVTGTTWNGEPAARLAVSNWRVDVQRDGIVVENVLENVVREHLSLSRKSNIK